MITHKWDHKPGKTKFTEEVLLELEKKPYNQTGQPKEKMVKSATQEKSWLSKLLKIVKGGK